MNTTTRESALEALRANAAELVQEALSRQGWRGRRMGDEFRGPSPLRQGSDSDGFCVNTRSGAWQDHVTGEAGDGLALFAALNGLDTRNAEDFIRVVDLGCATLGLEPPPAPGARNRQFAGQPAAPQAAIDPLARLAEARKVPLKALHDAGATARRAQGYDEVRFPMRAKLGLERWAVCGWRRRRADNKPFPEHKGAKASKARSLSADIPGLGAHGVLASLWPLPPEGPLLVVEGEMDLLAAAGAAPGLAVAGTPGANPGAQAIEAAAELASGRDIVLVPHGDESGTIWCAQVARAAAPLANSIKVVVPKPGIDLDDRLRAAEDPAQALRELLEKAAAFDASKIDVVPTIQIRKERLDLNAEAAVAVLAANYQSAQIYQRESALVRVVGAGDDGGRPAIAECRAGYLATVLAKNARWEATTASGEPRPAQVPESVLRAVLEAGEYPGVPALDLVAHAPFIDARGEPVAAYGYHQPSRAFLAYRGPAIEVPPNPTGQQRDEALGDLLEVVQDFPFVRATHRSGWLALLFTILARPAIPGPTPLFLVDANCPGTGKGRLVEAAHVLAAGHAPPATGFTGRDEEALRKQLFALASGGASICNFDNLRVPLESGVLDAALTADRVGDRVLGLNRWLEVPNRLVYVATGNNVVVRGDTARRTCYIRLEAREERPEERTGFRHPDLLEWILRERPRLLRAALVLLRHGFVAPRQPAKPWGSYEAWSAVVRQAILAAGLPDPIEAHHDMGEADAERESLEMLYLAIHESFHGWFVGAQEILDKAHANSSLKEAICAVCVAKDGGLPHAVAFGRKLKGFRARVAGGLALESKRDAGRFLWATRAVQATPENDDTNGLFQ